ncbi:MAG: hypothetical protein Q7R58_02525, partial [bacterium]|nr:hypothetical protein [bacterium]
MNENSIWVIIVLVIVVLGGWFLLSSAPASAPAPETSVTNQTPVIGSTTPEMIVEDTVPSVTVV